MHSAANPGAGLGYAETPVQKIAVVYGVVFLVVAIGGFIPGITTDIEAMEFAGHMSETMLFGIFQVSVLHNIVHFLFGIAGLVLALKFTGSKCYLIWGGLIYAVLLMYGLFFHGEHAANFVPLNTADNWLHGALAVTMIALGLFFGRRGRKRADG